MAQLLSLERWLEVARGVYGWVLANLFVATTIEQLAVVVLGFLVATLVARTLPPRLGALAVPTVVGRGVQVLVSLTRPVTWLVLLWLAASAATAFEQPSGVLRTAATLLSAWIAIALVSRLVANPIWAKLVTWVAWAIAALSIVGWLDPTIAILDAAVLEMGRVRISAYTVLKTTIVLALLVNAAIYAVGLVEARIRTSRALSPTMQVLLTKTLKIVLVGFAVLLAIRSVGIDLTALAVVGGAIGIGIGFGFGFQKAISNLISGVILLIDKSIKPGDVISVSGTYGWVTTLGGRYVAVVTRDGVEHLIPNDTLSSERVENWTHTHNRTRL